MVRSLAMLGHQGSPRFLEAVQRCMATRAQVRQRGMSRASLQLSWQLRACRSKLVCSDAEADGTLHRASTQPAS